MVQHTIPLQIPFRPWKKARSPKRILAIRLQAMGDLVITLPYLQHLRNSLPPDTVIDLLTREEVESIPKNLDLFNHVYSIGGGRNWKKQIVWTLMLLPKLLLRRYEVVIDLQNNELSKVARKTIRPKAWAEFDRWSSTPAGECSRLTIEAVNIGRCVADSNFKPKVNEDALQGLLEKNGWDGNSQLILLNPAAAFETRNWPLERYVKFAKIWMQYSPQSQFVSIGISTIEAKANFFKQELSERFINLVNKTSPIEAFALLKKMHLVISEDSGLMHMSWVSDVPTLAIFGATRADRATPLGQHTLLLHSSDLACGNCMLEKCRFNDNHCLTRYSAQFVFDKALELLNRSANTQIPFSADINLHQ